MLKRMVIVIVLLINLGAKYQAQSFTYNAVKVVSIDKTTGATKTNTEGCTLTWINLGERVPSRLDISAGATFSLTPRSRPSANHYIFDGQILTDDAGNAFVHFFYRHNGSCYRIVIEWTNAKFTYTIK